MGRGTPHNGPRTGLETGPPAAISTEAVQAELDKILASSLFQNSARLSQFLRFTVKTVLGGNGERIKEYLVGVEVFGRDGSYDPRIDPVVRVEAGRLRAKLEEYYRTQGQADPVLIELPKGSYVPVFRTRQQPAPARVSTDEPAPPAVAEPARQRAHRPFWGLPARSWAVLAGASLMILVLAVWTAVRRNAHRAAPTSIAVLPFMNLSAAPENEYLSDGFSEELTTSLAALQGLRVVARTSAFQFRGKGEDVRRIGEQLNVGAVLEGSVRKEGDRLRVTAQLISTADGYHLWSGAYDGQSSDLYTIQENIVQETAHALRMPAPAEKERPLAGRHTENPEAHELYLQGRYFWSKRGVHEMERSIELFEGAIQKDPSYAPAYAGLADTYAVMMANLQMSPARAVPLAKAAAMRALELNPQMAEAHASLGLVKSKGEWDWRGGEQEFRRAIALSPSYATAHHWLGVHLTVMGRFEEADAELRKAELLDPLSLMITDGLAENRLYWRRYDDAIEQVKRMRELNPTSRMGNAVLVYAYMGKGMHGKAVAAASDSLDPSEVGSLPVLAEALAASGERAKALDALHELEHASDERYVSRWDLACGYALLGERETAFRWLDKAFLQRDAGLAYLKVDPNVDSLRSDQRYTELLKRIGLAD